MTNRSACHHNSPLAACSEKYQRVGDLEQLLSRQHAPVGVERDEIEAPEREVHEQDEAEHDPKERERAEIDREDRAQPSDE